MHPTHKISHGRTRRRRSHDALKAPKVAVCPNCGSPKLPHAACSNCGYVRPGLALKTSEEA